MFPVMNGVNVQGATSPEGDTKSIDFVTTQHR
jgi:hypothetical protein